MITMKGNLAEKVEMHGVPVWMFCLFIDSVEIMIPTDA
jgi:hypothetical protein